MRNMLFIALPLLFVAEACGQTDLSWQFDKRITIIEERTKNIETKLDAVILRLDMIENKLSARVVTSAPVPVASAPVVTKTYSMPTYSSMTYSMPVSYSMPTTYSMPMTYSAPPMMIGGYSSMPMMSSSYGGGGMEIRTGLFGRVRSIQTPTTSIRTGPFGGIRSFSSGG